LFFFGEESIRLGKAREIGVSIKAQTKKEAGPISRAPRTGQRGHPPLPIALTLNDPSGKVAVGCRRLVMIEQLGDHGEVHPHSGCGRREVMTKVVESHVRQGATASL
jgi:hypothetical protein